MNEWAQQEALGKSTIPAVLIHALSPNQNAAVVALHFVAMYLELSVYSVDSLIVPYAGSTLLAVVGGFLNRSAIKSVHVTIIGLFFLAVPMIAIVPTITGRVFIVEFLKSYAQLITAMVSAYCMFIIIILSSREKLIQYFSIILAVIVVGSFFERFDAVREISDAFREFLYPKNLLYSADIRDVASYGAVRPRFFAREPSVVGIGAGILIATIFLLLRTRFVFKVGGALIVSLICMVVMRSPTIIFFTAAVFYGALALRPGERGKYSWLAGVGMVVGLLAMSFLLVYGTGLSGLSTRSILGGGSYVLRVFGPPLIWLESLRDNFLFGLGLGSFDALLPLARKAYGSYDIIALFPYIRTQRDGAFLISNAFWEYWIFFGVLGGTVLVILLARLFRVFGIQRLAFPFVAWLLALQTFGGVSAYRPWYILFTFAAVAFVAQKSWAGDRSARAA
ncbi:hypothetical protein [Sphingopyxis sp. 2PD]|uniref:hypothetical protein n=1 Tax=Sphingopyxis sp. 2PD TaxID=2502196 RepID=UPI0010F5C065|nr:hypothetical protein [Sphingopyxis sp. 2PD]